MWLHHENYKPRKNKSSQDIATTHQTNEVDDDDDITSEAENRFQGSNLGYAHKFELKQRRPTDYETGSLNQDESL